MGLSARQMPPVMPGQEAAAVIEVELHIASVTAPPPLLAPLLPLQPAASPSIIT